MQLDNATYQKVIDSITERTNRLVMQSMTADTHQATARFPTLVEVKFSHKAHDTMFDRVLIVNVAAPHAEGSIGIWFEPETADISVWRYPDGDSFYEFHDVIRDWDELLEHISKALDIFDAAKTDVTEVFSRAHANRTLWMSEKASEAIQHIQASDQSLKLNWDQGEDWAIFTLNGEPVLYLCLVLPVAFAKPAHVSLIPSGIEVIPVTDFAKDTFRIVPEVAAIVFPNRIWQDKEVVDIEKFTVQDLWWATV